MLYVRGSAFDKLCIPWNTNTVWDCHGDMQRYTYNYIYIYMVYDLALTCFIMHASSHMQHPVCCTQTTSTSLYYTVYACIYTPHFSGCDMSLLLWSLPHLSWHYVTFASTSKSFVLFLHLSIVTARSAHSSEHAMTPADMVIVAIYSSLCLRCLFLRHLLFIVFKPAKATSFPACWFIAGNLSVIVYVLTPYILEHYITCNGNAVETRLTSNTWCVYNIMFISDYDECRRFARCQYSCVNTQGSYRCVCPSGLYSPETRKNLCLGELPSNRVYCVYMLWNLLNPLLYFTI